MTITGRTAETPRAPMDTRRIATLTGWLMVVTFATSIQGFKPSPTISDSRTESGPVQRDGRPGMPVPRPGDDLLENTRPVERQ